MARFYYCRSKRQFDCDSKRVPETRFRVDIYFHLASLRVTLMIIVVALSLLLNDKNLPIQKIHGIFFEWREKNLSFEISNYPSRLKSRLLNITPAQINTFYFYYFQNLSKTNHLDWTHKVCRLNRFARFARTIGWPFESARVIPKMHGSRVWKWKRQEFPSIFSNTAKTRGFHPIPREIARDRQRV